MLHTCLPRRISGHGILRCAVVPQTRVSYDDIIGRRWIKWSGLVGAVPSTQRGLHDPMLIHSQSLWVIITSEIIIVAKESIELNKVEAHY